MRLIKFTITPKSSSQFFRSPFTRVNPTQEELIKMRMVHISGQFLHFERRGCLPHSNIWPTSRLSSGESYSGRQSRAPRGARRKSRIILMAPQHQAVFSYYSQFLKIGLCLMELHQSPASFFFFFFYRPPPPPPPLSDAGWADHSSSATSNNV